MPPLAPAAGWKALWDIVHERFPGAVLSSGLRCTDMLYHCNLPGAKGFPTGRAIDVSGSAALMLQIDQWIAANYRAVTRELIHAPGINLWNGSPHLYDAGTLADHRDHVHWAV